MRTVAHKVREHAIQVCQKSLTVQVEQKYIYRKIEHKAKKLRFGGRFLNSDVFSSSMYSIGGGGGGDEENSFHRKGIFC
jgi:hypothetical protein